MFFVEGMQATLLPARVKSSIDAIPELSAARERSINNQSLRFPMMISFDEDRGEGLLCRMLTIS